MIIENFKSLFLVNILLLSLEGIIFKLDVDFVFVLLVNCEEGVEYLMCKVVEKVIRLM